MPQILWCTMGILSKITEMGLHFRINVSSMAVHINGCTNNTVADPGFPVGGGGVHPLGGCGPPMRVLFDENVCENERIGSHIGWRAPGTLPPRSANAIDKYHSVIHIR